MKHDPIRISCLCFLGFVVLWSGGLGTYLLVAHQDVPQFITAALASSLGGFLVLIKIGDGKQRPPEGEEKGRGDPPTATPGTGNR